MRGLGWDGLWVTAARPGGEEGSAMCECDAA